MTGYHYTTYENWLKIRVEGLVPQPILKKEINEFFPNGVSGIWLWKKRFTGAAHAGSVIYQLAYKATPRVVLLSVQYDKKGALVYHDPDNFYPMSVNVSHNGYIENWEYHDGSEESVIVTNPIPANKVRLLREYDIVKMFK